MIERRLVIWLVGPLAVMLLAMFGPTPRGLAADALAGSQGTDTSLAATPSQVTVHGRDEFSDLAITINQTKNLTNQAVSITWTGGVPSGPAPFRDGHFLQIFQCWGDDDGSVPGNPGPPPEQCVQGAAAGNFGGGPNGHLQTPGSAALSRIVSFTSWQPTYDVGVADPVGAKWRPFRSVDGKQVDFQWDHQFLPSFAGNYWLDPYFDPVTTNEIGAAATASDGTGAELLEVNTGVQSSGLGCGQRRQVLADLSRKVPQCWIVIVPRGTPAEENAGTALLDSNGVMTSPLGPQAWPNRIAVPIEFNPVDSPCSISATQRRLSGTELLVGAVTSWQPALCSGGDLPPYAYAQVNDNTARQQLVRGSSSMVVVSRPIERQETDPEVVYAPLAASGVVIGFNIERTPKAASDIPPEAVELSGIRFANINLTPRLVAKLLTQSYANQVNIGNVSAGLAWPADNPVHLYADNDFLRFNPEFAQQQASQGRQVSGLYAPSGTSDSARQVWEWILADPEAAAWLGGAADEWGMVVNPAYAFLADGAPESFPKAEPHCYQPPMVTSVTPNFTPRALCGIDWMPFATGLVDAAIGTRKAFDGARIGADTVDARNAEQYWKRVSPQAVGSRAFLSLTDSASAAQYGIQTARLSRAGDDGADRTFIAPDRTHLAAGVAAMQPSVIDADVLVAAPASQPADAYPLTTLSYAAIYPLKLDQPARDEYAAFIEYAVTSGQLSGFELGQLPPGYVPLPRSLREQSLAAAFQTRNMVEPPATTTTTVPPTSTTTSTTTTTTTTTVPVTTRAPAQTSGGQTSTGQNNANQSSGQSSTASQQTSQQPATTPTSQTTLPAAPTGTLPVDTASDTAPPSSAPNSTVPAGSDASPETTVPEPIAEQPAALTPDADVSPMRFAVAGFTGVGMLAALIVLELTKRPRRATQPDPLDGDLFDTGFPIDQAIRPE